MAVVYLIFNEGYAASAGADWTRPDLCLEALRLARMLAHLVPDEPEVLGLQALLELQGARLRARRDADGVPVLLEAQDRRRWDRLLIGRGLDALDRAEKLVIEREARRRLRPPGRDRRLPCPREESRGHRLGRDRRPLRRARADVARTGGRGEPRGRPRSRVRAGRRPRRARRVADHPAVAAWHLVPAVRGDLLERAGRREEAAAAFRDAAALTRNADERGILLRRAGS